MDTTAMETNNQPPSALRCSMRLRILLSLITLTGSVLVSAHEAVAQATVDRNRVTRIFWQDRLDDSLKWADLIERPGWRLQPTVVSGFPKLDVEKQDLVQMKILDGTLLVGVCDQEDGEFESGWVAVETGVREGPHGNHSDWRYYSSPMVSTSQLDKQQGNPAHLYVYDERFYLANDQKDGFTQFATDCLTKSSTCGRFFPGGGNHITMAAVDNLICHSTWIDGGGPNLGQVDVVNLQKPTEESHAYSFHLPTGGIHGATENSGRVFFAPAEGICWVDADVQARQTADSVKVHKLSLGENKESEKPLRTGAFVNHRNWILCTTGQQTPPLSASLTLRRVIRVW